ncbi:MAG: signal transduction histidine kinase [Alphaproteobacteria bacterium]|nr:MAG: signal transduction histidine kinase [Caulobacteraceae bacterium]TPW07772.1 MAG: signal transduction histidine kinase [Alphaproteobacteria bacterium]
MPWRSLRGRVALILGATLAPSGLQALHAGEVTPVTLWLVAAIAASASAHVFVARPLLSLEGAANAYARGETPQIVEASDDPPSELVSLRNSLLVMAGAIRGREERVALALKEQRVLLREVNHRVMNNLQVVLSILSIQARDSDNEDQKLALARARARVQLLALTQSQIYASGEVHDVRLDQLVAEIGRAAIGARGEIIDLALALAPVRVSVDLAAPMAFLIAECLTATVERARADTRTTIALSLLEQDDGMVVLSISSSDAGDTRVASLSGRRLILDLARELGATVSQDPDQPLTTRLTLPAADREGAVQG